MPDNDDKPWYDNTPDRGYGYSSDNPYSGWGFNGGNGDFTGTDRNGHYQDTADYGKTFPNDDTGGGW